MSEAAKHTPTGILHAVPNAIRYVGHIGPSCRHLLGINYWGCFFRVVSSVPRSALAPQPRFQVLPSEPVCPLEMRHLGWQLPVCGVLQVLGRLPCLVGIPSGAWVCEGCWHRDRPSCGGLGHPDAERHPGEGGRRAQIGRHHHDDLAGFEGGGLGAVMLEASIKNEDAEDAALAELDEEVVNDVCLVGEVPEVKKIMKTRTSQVEARRESRQRVKQVVALAYGSVKEVAATARQAAAAKRAAAKGAAGKAKEVEKLRSRWLADLRADPKGVVVRECPAGASIFPDSNNGRFLVSARDRSRKSYSWTVRGMDEAARLALTQAWLWSEEIHGIPPPPHVCLQ